MHRWHVKGNLFLTGEEWSSTHRTDGEGRPTRRVWYAVFTYGKFIGAKSETAHDYSRALCVRQPGQ